MPLELQPGWQLARNGARPPTMPREGWNDAWLPPRLRMSNAWQGLRNVRGTAAGGRRPRAGINSGSAEVPRVARDP